MTTPVVSFFSYIVADVDGGLAALHLLHPLAVAVVDVGSRLAAHGHHLQAILDIVVMGVSRAAFAPGAHVAGGIVGVAAEAPGGSDSMRHDAVRLQETSQHVVIPACPEVIQPQCTVARPAGKLAI